MYQNRDKKYYSFAIQFQFGFGVVLFSILCVNRRYNGMHAFSSCFKSVRSTTRHAFPDKFSVTRCFGSQMLVCGDGDLSVSFNARVLNHDKVFDLTLVLLV